jgi:hypothetical protein
MKILRGMNSQILWAKDFENFEKIIRMWPQWEHANITWGIYYLS